MDYVKPYCFEVQNQEPILINGSTGIVEYKIQSIDSAQSLLKVSAFNREDKIKIPFNNIDLSSLKSIRRYFAEEFI